MTPSVLHVIPAIAARYGGPSAATLGVCHALEAAGMRTVVATTDADGPGRLPVATGRVQEWSGTPTVFFRRRFSEAYKWSAGLSGWLQAHVTEFDIVHVHAVFPHSSLAAGRACRDAGVPYLVRPLGTLDPWSLGQKRRRKRWLLRLGARQLLAGAAALHYTSAEERRLAQSVVPGLPRGIVVPLGIDEAFFESFEKGGAGGSGPYILSVSRFDAKKGLDLLIRAFHEIADAPQFHSWRLVLAGDGDPGFVAALKALAAAGAGRARIEFTGWVSGAAKRDLLREASLFALPSQQENFGISLIEAMAAGVPVLMTPGVNLARDISDAGAGWVSERSAAALSTVLRSAMADEGERVQRGQCARRFAEPFRWSKVAERLRTVYEDVRQTALS